MEATILKLKSIFNSFDPRASKEELAVSLTRFEIETRPYGKQPLPHVIILWMRNLFLQNMGALSRAEELLDQALEIVESNPDMDFKKWPLKINLSLGHIHRAQSNYTDAHFFLQKALENSQTQPELIRFQGEVYALLADVCLHMNQFISAREYASAEKQTAFQNYIESGPDASGPAIIYAYSLIDYCRVKRNIGLVDHTHVSSIEEALKIFIRFSYIKGILRASLESAQLLFHMNFTEKALLRIQTIESDLLKDRMHKDYLSAGLLRAKIHRKMLEYGRAKNKLKHLAELAEENELSQAPVLSDIYFEMGEIYYDTDREDTALEFYKKSAKIGMLGGVKRQIIRAFDAARKIDKQKAKIFLTSDLIYQDTAFFKNRLATQVSPFKTHRSREKLFASTLFVDIAGFSHLMKKLDEKDTIQMLDELIDRLCVVIYQNKGYIDKFLGDGFMAIFEHGESLDQEMALNGIRASVDMNRTIRTKNRKFKAAYGLQENISFRMGISTGKIHALFLGNYIKREFTYMGNAVNLASKLENAAGQRRLLMDGATHDLIAPRVIDSLETAHLPGFGESEVYQFHRLKRAHEIQD